MMAAQADTPARKRTEMRSRYFARDEATRLGWNTDHPSEGGAFLEEHEVVDYFPDLAEALGQDRPDFAALDEDGHPRLIIECKSQAHRIENALEQAKRYAEAIDTVPGYDVRLAVGVAGTPDKRVYTRTQFRINGYWRDLESFGFPLTQLPTPTEVELAVERGDGTTDVELPDEREFYDAAIKISSQLRLAKVEEAKRPIVIGSIILALWQGDFPLHKSTVVSYINANVDAAVERFGDVPAGQREQLNELLSLGADAAGVRDRIELLIQQLERLNIRSIMRSGIDFLGKFYETFLRYGCNTKNMGIVFTPRHITRFCADLAEVGLGHRVYDPACGTGGFLVAGFDRMMSQASSEEARQAVRRSLHGRDTNATVWALAMLNMMFRGDGKSRIEFRSAFSGSSHIAKFDRVLMNPPFSQEGEPEIDFIDHGLQALSPGGIATIVVKTNVLIDPDLTYWRKALIDKHHVLGVISLPPDLFYPTAASTVVLVVRAHSADPGLGTFLAAVSNDGFEISKKRRISREGSDLPKLCELFHDFLNGREPRIPGFVGVVSRAQIADGSEICAERWLPSPPFRAEEYDSVRRSAFQQIAMAAANFPDAVDAVIEDFEGVLRQEVEAPSLDRGRLSDWFAIKNGSSTGLRNYAGGDVPYVSSGDAFNSVVGMVAPPEGEIYLTPHVTVTAFGHAALQPWRFCARGNGGSAVRVLRPRYAMNVAQLLWFVGQINDQRWRFHYGRMATGKRLGDLMVDRPPDGLSQVGDVAARVRRFRSDVARLVGDDNDGELFGTLAEEWRGARSNVLSSARRMADHPAYLRIIGMGERAVPQILRELQNEPDHWFVALHSITGADPVEEESRGRLRPMADAWIDWGKSRGYI